jgi:pimeloyl-ACP methyl ester carboxylesterase
VADDELPPTRLIKVAGVEIRHAAAGRGPAVVLMHGLGATAYSWRRAWKRLAESRTVHLFDWPGHGRSAKPSDFDYSLHGYSRFLVALLDALELPKADLVGNSLGGVVSLLTALERPERVGRLALIGTPTYPESHPRFLWALQWPLVGRLFELVLGEWAVRACAKDVYIDRSIITEELIAEYSAALRMPGGRRAVAEFIRNALPPDADRIMSRFRELPHPTLVIWGERDCMVDGLDVERFVGEVPGARLVRLPGLGHAPQEERPDLVVDALSAFLGTH